MEKDVIRKRVWAKMEATKVSRFPGAKGRIPNFVGAERCAGLLEDIASWKDARVIKSNPDSPQRQIRWRALKEGKIVYMAVPRLADVKPFVELDPAKIPSGSLYEASSIRGAFALGRQVGLQEIRMIDLIVCGSVAVNKEGYRIGKGEGYSELEYALCKEAGKIRESAAIITSVHPVQIVKSRISAEPFDFTVDYVLTPGRILKCRSGHPKPPGILWEYLGRKKIEAIPALRNLYQRRRKHEL